jgi:hypothetical protein
MKFSALPVVPFVALLSAACVAAQTSTVPRFLSYQGRVTDAAGSPIGNSAPVNRTVTFRLYNASTGGVPLYAESQTVTISAGEFSVLIGNGSGLGGVPGPSAPAPTPYLTLPSVINQSTSDSLYLGITVDDGNSSTSDPEIVPRQQLVSAAFALRATMAETVASGAVTSAMIGTSAVESSNLKADAITTTKIADRNVTGSKIASSTITASNIDTTSIGLWSPSGTSIFRNSNVGIGNSNPSVPLSFAAALGDKIDLLPVSSTSRFGIGVQSNLLQIFTGYNTADTAFGFGSSANMTEIMRIKGTGHVGIGTASPGARLHVNGGSALIQNTANPTARLTSGGTDYTELALATSAGSFSTSASANDSVVRSSGSLHLQSGTGTAAVSISTANRVGFGTASPTTTIDAVGAIHAHDSAVGADNSYHGTFRSTRPSTSNQHINLIRSGQAVWSLGYAPGTSSFGIGGGNPTDASFSPVFTISQSGRVGIGTSNYNESIFNVGGSVNCVGSRNGSPGYARMWYDSVSGAAVFEAFNTSQNNGTWRGFRINGNNDLDWFSDARLKTNVEDAEPMLDRLMQVRFHRYHWIDSTQETKEFGVIAQELQPLFPDLVAPQSNGMLTVGYTSFATIACKAIQELKASHDSELSALREEIDEKDERISSLEKRLGALEKLLSHDR